MHNEYTAKWGHNLVWERTESDGEGKGKGERGKMIDGLARERERGRDRQREKERGRGREEGGESEREGAREDDLWLALLAIQHQLQITTIRTFFGMHVADSRLIR